MCSANHNASYARREAARELAMLWPFPITVNELELVDVQSGRSLGDEAKRSRFEAYSQS